MRRRVLLVSPFAPVSEGRHGSARAIRGLVDALAERHDVVLAHTDQHTGVDADPPERCEVVQLVDVVRHGRWTGRAVGAVGLARGRDLWTSDLKMTRIRRQVGVLIRRHRPDVVQIEHPLLGDVLASIDPGHLRIVTIYDTAASRHESLHLQRRGPALLHRFDALAAVRQERRVLALADAGVVFSERDRALLAPDVPAHVELVTIPLGWTVPDLPLDPIGGTPPTLLFVGNFMHPPNIEAAVRLATRIAPLVRADHPEVVVEIVGPSPPDEVLALEQAGIHVTGEVDDVGPYLDRASVVVAPISIGGGTRVKVLEALAAGKAVVSTVRGSEGIAAGSEALVVADNDHDFASAVRRLIADENARRRLAEGARAWALQELTWSTMAARYGELYDRLDERRAAGELHRAGRGRAGR